MKQRELLFDGTVVDVPNGDGPPLEGVYVDVRGPHIWHITASGYLTLKFIDQEHALRIRVLDSRVKDLILLKLAAGAFLDFNVLRSEVQESYRLYVAPQLAWCRPRSSPHTDRDYESPWPRRPKNADAP